MAGKVGVGNGSNTGVLDVCSAHMWDRKLCLKSHAAQQRGTEHDHTRQNSNAS